MTVPDISNYIVHRGNSAATVFPYSFRIPEASMVVVEIRDYETKVITQVLTPDDYIITGVSKDNYNGGAVTYVPPTGPLTPEQEIVISRRVPYSQDLALQNQGSFHPKSLEYQLDLIVMQIQQTYYEITGAYIDIELLFNQIADIRDQVIVARDQSLAARDFSAAWASDPEDGPLIIDGVNPPGHSSYHYSRKAAKFSYEAQAAAMAAGDVDAAFDTYAEADAALPGLSDGDKVVIWADETQDGALTRYVVEGGVLVLKATIGDMRESVYDPDENSSNAFDLSNQYGNKPTDFPTVADLLADTSLGYSAARKADQVEEGDIITAQGFRYEVAASDATDAHVETSGGVKLYALPGERGIWLEQLGVVFDGITDNTSTLQRISTALAAYRGVLSAGSGVCKLNGTFEVPRHASFICNGAVFDAAGSTDVFDTAVILKRGATPERIADLDVDANEFGVTLTFATPHNRAAGDTIILFNPTDGSFFAGRPVYREGQFAKVGEVVSSTVLRVDRELYATHDHSVTEVYSCDDLATGIMEGFTAIAPGAGTGNGAINGWRVEYAEGVELKKTASRGSDNASAVLRLGFRCKGIGQDEKQLGANPGFSTQYGFSIANCQESTFVGGTYEGNRHGVALGGFNEFSIPNREVHVLKFTAKTHAGSLAAADWHGNVEYCSYADGTCYGGAVNIAGDRNKIRNITVHGDDDCFGIFGREIVGMSHEVSDVTLYLGRQDNNRGVGIDIGGATTAFSSDCRRGGMLDVSNLTVHARNQDRRVIRVVNRGYVGDPWSLRVRGLTVHMPNAEATFALVQAGAESSYDHPQSMEVTSVEALGMPVARKLVALCDASVPLRLDSQSGVVSLTTDTDITVIESDLQEFLRFTYPRNPCPVASMIGTNTDGTNRIGAYVRSVSTDGIRVGISRTDGVGNFGGAVTRQVSWEVGIKDF